MEIPKFQETFLPILKVLSDGKTRSTMELKQAVVQEFVTKLSPDVLMEKTKGGEILIYNRVAWGKTYLKQAGMIHQPAKAVVQITPKGEAILKQGRLLLKDLLKDTDFLAHRKAHKEAQEVEPSLSEGETPQDLLDSGFKAIENQTKSDLLDKLKSLDPYFFQRVVLLLLEKMGYGDFSETSRGADGGIDGIINQDKLGVEKIYMQAKKYGDGQVGGRDMTNFIGAITRDRVRKGIFVTTSSFSKQALENSQNAGNVILVDGERLVELMLEYNVGVQTRSSYLVKEIDEDFFEEN